MTDIVVISPLVIRGLDGIEPALRAEAEARGLSERAFSDAAAGHPHLFDDLRWGIYPAHHVMVSISAFLGRPISVRGLESARHLEFRNSPTTPPAQAPERWFGAGWARDGRVRPWSSVGLVQALLNDQGDAR